MKQAGMMEAYLIGALGAVLLAGALSGFAYQTGKKVERVEWQAREQRADRAAADKLAQAQRDKDTIEHNHQAAMVAASQAYQQELKHVRTQKDRVIADLRAGALRLRDPGTSYALGVHPLPATGPAAGGCDAAAGGQLSDEAAEFLVGLASESDEVAKQLGRCQEVAQTYQSFFAKGEKP